MRDLEFGPIKISERLRRYISYYHNNKRTIKKFLLVWGVLTIAIIMKMGYQNVDTVIETATAITLDEPSYVPFTIRETPVADPPQPRRFPLKESHINIRAQIHNIKTATHVVRNYLEDMDFVCMPIRYFGVDYDMVIFPNATMINPEVVGESEHHEFVQELGAGGEIKRMKRPQYLRVMYLDEDLNRKVTTLWGDQSYCFAHYEFVK